MDTPLDNPGMEIFTDGSSFVRDGKRKAGYSVVTAEQVLEAESLPQGTSTQLAELVSLTRALELSRRQQMGLIIYVSLLLLTPKILSLLFGPQDNVFLSWAHSYAAFHNQSNCCVCGALSSSSMEGFPWWTSPLKGKDFL
ncbi:endogenous retrovirus group PABLB member 1 Env polyprotein-like [Bubalus kerabau]|uniref:endogenous retrovirus group PABLB member 1 Env polyprotein-like n=1 Tax=Bubalus carabanensis TaxID=3119969 RepID=UPI00244EFE56|nr:endogenous retrovirus group PABLB member 1 Env polyprotein-like [Bubalus carabanensis]